MEPPTFFLLQARGDDLGVDPNFPGHYVSLVLVVMFNYRALQLPQTL
jgi:hypothetical protein